MTERKRPRGLRVRRAKVTPGEAVAESFITDVPVI